MKAEQKSNNGFKLFVIVLIGVILFFSSSKNQEKFINFINNTSMVRKDLEVIRSIPMKESIDDIAYYDNSIIVWMDNKLVRYNTQGSKEWEKEFNLNSPEVTFGDEGIYVYEALTGNVYSLNTKGETISKFQLQTEVRNVIEGNKNILLHVKKDDNEGINILDTNGKMIQNKLVEGDNVLTYCINRSNSKYAFATLNLKGNSIRSEIQAYNMEGEFLSTTYLDNEIVFYLNFIKDDTLIVMTDKGLYSIDDSSILWQKDHQLIKDIYINEKGINILYGNTFENISFDGISKYKHSFLEEYRKSIPFNEYMIIYGPNNIIGLKEGKEVLKYESEESILKVLNGGQNLIIVYENRIDIVSI